MLKCPNCKVDLYELYEQTLIHGNELVLTCNECGKILNITPIKSLKFKVRWK